MELRRQAKCGESGLWGIATAMLAMVACGAPASGQLFEPPLYRGSAEGVPLAGQDGWYVPGAGASEWRVYRNGGSELGLDPLPAGEHQIAGVALEAPIGAPQRVEHSIHALRETMFIMVSLAVDFDGSLPAGEEIGRMTLEPEGGSASFGWVARRDDGGADTWTFDLIYYSAEGERRQEPLFEGLAPGAWHELRVGICFQKIEGIGIVDTKSWRRHSAGSRGFYLRGGAAGRPPLAKQVRFSAGAGESAHAAQIALGVDNLLIGQSASCYSDCDHSGELDFFDFLCFQNRFAGRDPYADCDSSGVLDFFDFLCFQDAFVIGCGP